MSQVVDPLNTLRPLREDELDQHPAARQADAAPLAYDVFRNGGELVIEFDAPGVNRSDISVAVEGRSLVVSVRRVLSRRPGIDVIETGRQHGTFSQRLWLGDRWDLDGLRAGVHNGVLTVRAPLVPELARRSVTVCADPAGGLSGTSGWQEPAGGGIEEGRVETAA